MSHLTKVFRGGYELLEICWDLLLDDGAEVANLSRCKEAMELSAVFPPAVAISHHQEHPSDAGPDNTIQQ
jgi:hypothetical protein